MWATWTVYGSCTLMATLGWLLTRCTGGFLSGGCRIRIPLTRQNLRLFFQGGWKQTGAGKAAARFLRERDRIKGEWEIGEAISYMRNAVAMGRGGQMSTGLILEELSELSGVLTPAYLKMLQYLRMNEKDKVVETLWEAAGCELSRDFSRLLLQWEELPPEMLVETLASYQDSLREVRQTRQKKRDEMVSDLIYLPVISNVMLVLVNFIYVAYFIDQRDMLLHMFA